MRGFFPTLKSILTDAAEFLLNVSLLLFCRENNFAVKQK